MTETEMVNAPSMWATTKYRLAITGMSLLPLVGLASAEVNLSGISDVITGFTGIIPDLMDLIIAVIPMVFTLAVYSFIIGLLAAILGLIKVNL